jgi:hypothetical protein
MKIICAGSSDEGLAFSARYADYAFCLGKGVNTPTAFSANNERLMAATAKTGRDVRIYALFMIIAAETDEEAMEKWISYREGVDEEAVAWLGAQGAADKTSTTTNVRQLADRESAVNLNMGTLVGSYENIARMLDEASTVPNTGGVLLTFDDFIAGTEAFGTRIQPLMKCRAREEIGRIVRVERGDRFGGEVAGRVRLDPVPDAEQEAPAGPQHAQRLAIAAHPIGKEHRAELAGDNVERRVREGEGERVGLAERDARRGDPGCGHVQHRLVEVGRDQARRRHRGGDRLGDDAGAGGGFEDRGRRRRGDAPGEILGIGPEQHRPQQPVVERGDRAGEIAPISCWWSGGWRRAGRRRRR